MNATPLPSDEAFMRRALRLAMNGRGLVEPNPMVGCVIVKNGRVIGEGWHRAFGGPHAEPEALAACAESPEGATAYVTLEPCCHTNKKTPPCAPRLIAAKLARVVVGCTDPNPAVSGRGLATLRGAEIDVTAPLLEPECRQLIAPFWARMSLRLPYVTLKWAESADGKVAGPGGRRVQISNEASTRLVHQLRARSDAILVGINTVLADDPMLTVRGVETARPLRRIVLDAKLRIPLDCRLVATAREHPLIIYTAADTRGSAARSDFERRGVDVRHVACDAAGSLSLPDVLSAIEPAVTHVLVEPGPTLAQSSMRWGVADRVWVFRSPRVIGEEAAPRAARVPPDYVVTGELDVGGDRLTECLNPASPAYFAASPSADLVLAG